MRTDRTEAMALEIWDHVLQGGSALTSESKAIKTDNWQ